MEGSLAVMGNLTFSVSRWVRICLNIVLMFCLLFQVQPSRADFQRQLPLPQQKARALLARMTPEEKVGQLFLVTFVGTDVSKRSQIYDLIANRRVGGVVFQRSNDNFASTDRTISEAYRMISALQLSAWESSGVPVSVTPGAPPVTWNYIPLFVGISQEGDLFPYDQILNGMSTLPNLMAIGATWKPELAQKVGKILGSELSALGFNLLLGPSLDVLEIYRPESGDDLGTRTFGGDPYWVGEMAKGYIAGLHQGGNNRLAVIAKHFPGRGSSDRPPDEEVATVRKSLEQLKQIELAPFFAVTGNAPRPETAADGLLASHIRYQGFQGNIRQTTRPLSFDQAAMELILSLPQLSGWRSSGGLMVSDNLGSAAVKKFFDPSGRSFDGRQIARNAFLAGNDLLYLNNFVSSGDPDSYTTILKTLEFFTQKYREDAPFAQRVNSSVEMILTLKYRMYPEFDYNQVTPLLSGLNSIGQDQGVTFEVARNSVALLSPDPAELLNVLPRPPEARERIVFVSDSYVARQCTQCPEQQFPAGDALQSAVMRLYGPRSGGQVGIGRLINYTFTDVWKLLSGVKEVPPVEEDLRNADWVIFSMLKVSADRKESQVLKKILADRYDLIRNKKVVVFAFNAPYYLDSTEISKISAYYVLYGKSAPFIEVAARVLFQELTPVIGIPVSVPGIGYDLITATSPHPNQVIPLILDTTPAGGVPATQTPESARPTIAVGATPRATPTVNPTNVPRFKVGDTIPLRTGVIYDHNRHQVPDGTVVRFIFTTSGEISGTTQIDTVTTQGVARTRYRIDRPGNLEVRVISEPATISELLRLDITGGGSAAITVIAPTPQPTQPPPPTATITPTVVVTPTPTVKPPAMTGVRDLSVSFIGLVLASGILFLAGKMLLSVRWGVRWGLLTMLGGLAAYNYLALNLPGSQALLENYGIGGTLFITMLGGSTGWLAGYLWQRRQPTSPSKRRESLPVDLIKKERVLEKDQQVDRLNGIK